MTTGAVVFSRLPENRLAQQDVFPERTATLG
jgi:hypothetical protein